jgi:hypothetical protein
MKMRAMLIALTVVVAQVAGAANTPPLSEAWNIASSGRASSSGELLFRVTPGDGGDATEITVSVSSGTDDAGVANNIRRALNSQLRADRFNVQQGEGANVLLTSQREPGFSIELVNSDVENVRVVVQSATPVAPPTVPQQATPANPPTTTSGTPPAPGDVVPPQPGPGEAAPSAPPASSTPGMPAPSAPSTATPSAPGSPTSSAPSTPSTSAPSSATPSAPNTPSSSAPGSATPSAPASAPPRLIASTLLPAPRFRYRFP